MSQSCSTMKLYFLLLVTLIFSFSEAAKILLFHPSGSKSHIILTTSIAEELAVRSGHQVTIVTPYEWKFKNENIREIAVTQAIPEFQDQEMKDLLKDGNQGFNFSLLGKLQVMMVELFKNMLKDPRVVKMMEEETFDLVFFSWFLNGYQIGLAPHFKAPYVVFSFPARLTQAFSGEHVYPATVPSIFTRTQGKMSFWQRFMNFMIAIIEEGASRYHERSDEAIYNELFPDRSRYPPFQEVQKNCSLLLSNFHFTQGIIRPNLPTTVDIGGIQIKDNPKPLPADLQKFMDEAEHGVILWTFGSNVLIHHMPQEKQDAMFRVLGRQKERIVIRWDLDDKSVLPKNFYASKWLPQASILAHNKTKLFITHGGAGGTLEAMYNAVPIVPVPLFGDQPKNAESSVAQGWAYMLEYSDITKDDVIEAAINEVLTNPKYKNRAQELSNLYRDRLASAMDTAIYWIEYVIRHKGAPHLQYQGKDLNIFQRTSLDVIAFILVVLYVAFKVTILIFKKLFGLCFGSKKKTKKD